MLSRASGNKKVQHKAINLTQTKQQKRKKKTKKEIETLDGPKKANRSVI